jgi:hypothetical protein
MPSIPARSAFPGLGAGAAALSVLARAMLRVAIPIRLLKTSIFSNGRECLDMVSVVYWQKEVISPHLRRGSCVDTIRRTTRPPFKLHYLNDCPINLTASWIPAGTSVKRAPPSYVFDCLSKDNKTQKDVKTKRKKVFTPRFPHFHDSPTFGFEKYFFRERS